MQDNNSDFSFDSYYPEEEVTNPLENILPDDAFQPPVVNQAIELEPIDKYAVPPEDVFEVSEQYIEDFEEACNLEGVGYEAPRFPVWSEKMEGLMNGFYIFAAFSNAGKAMALDTPILKTNGKWTTIGDIKIGEKVWGDDGKPTTVVCKSKLFHNHKCYRITFDDKTTFVADADHLWLVYDKSIHFDENNKKVLKMRDIAENYYYLSGKCKYKKYRYAVPMQKPLEYEKKDLPIDPYVLGLWLGDGDSNSARMSCDTRDYENLKKNIEACGYHVTDIQKNNSKHGGTYTICTEKRKKKNNSFNSLLRELNLIKNKHIPEMYLHASIEQRFALLQGLLDTDGHSGLRGCEFSQKEKSKINNTFGELLSSLGIKYGKQLKRTKCCGKDFYSYRYIFRSDKQNPCFRLDRKIRALSENSKPRSIKYKTIVNVEPVQTMTTQCIEVNNKSHCFCVGKTLTVTHNTAYMMNLALDYALHEPNKLFMIYYSLDDTKEDVLARIVSMRTRIPISVVRKPKRYEKMIEEGCDNSSAYQAMLEARKKGIEEIKTLSKHFMVVDSEKIDCIERMLNHAKMVKRYLQNRDPENNVIIVIDSLMDINIDSQNFREEKDRNTKISRLVKQYATTEIKCPIFGTAHVKKNTAKRVTISDLKESGRYEYDARVVCLLSNDVSRNGQNATVYYNSVGSTEKNPVLEIQWAKNKASSFKERTYCYFLPEHSLANECNKEQMKQYDAIIYGD